jgi:N-acyl homoserine lactone hydrolase
MFAFLIRHPGGPILFETGIGQGNELLDRYYQVQHRPLAEELDTIGYRLGDIRAIVNSHLHFDHAGSNWLFPGVPIYVQVAEQQAAREPHYTVPEWINFEGAEYVTIDGDSRVVSEVRIVSAPGHTPGHQCLVVETTGGRLALAGQAIYSKTEYDFIRRTGTAPTEDPPPDPERYLASAIQLMELRPRQVFFSHDRAVWTDAA